MAEEYALRCAHIGSSKDTPLSEDEVRAAVSSKTLIILARGVEETFDIALQNHIELEHHLLGIALEHSLSISRDEKIFRDARRGINLRLANYMATARLYIDQIQHDIGQALESEEATIQTREGIRAQYDARFGYRAVEALRNYSQHRGLPVRSVTLSTSRDERFEPPRIRFGIVPAIDVTQLERDGKFKASVLGELQEHADKNGLVPLLPLVREHSEGIGMVHKQARTLLRERAREAEELIKSLVTRAEHDFDGDVAFLAIVCKRGDQGYEVVEYISNVYAEQRNELLKRNEHIMEIASHFVSSE